MPCWQIDHTPIFSVYSSEKMEKEKEEEDVDDSLQF